MKKLEIADWKELEDRKPAHALVSNVDLVIIRYDAEVSVLYGRCLHRRLASLVAGITGLKLWQLRTR